MSIQNTLPFRMLGLTGGIATGKSTASAHLASRGFLIIDADLLAKVVVEPGTEGLAAVVEAFGEGVLDEDGSLSRARLGEIVFKDEGALKQLMQITHPRIAMETQSRIQAAREAGHPCVVYDAPLMVENGLQAMLDYLIVVTAREDVQIARMMARDGFDETECRRRVATQLPMERKIEVADSVIDNSGELAHTLAQLDDLVAGLPGALWPETPDAGERLEAYLSRGDRR